MRIEFSQTTKSRGPVAEATIFFDADGPFHGLALVGISIWSGERGNFVTLPSRAYEEKGRKKFYNFLRAADPEDRKAEFRFKDWVLDSYRGWLNSETDR